MNCYSSFANLFSSSDFRKMIEPKQFARTKKKRKEKEKEKEKDLLVFEAMLRQIPNLIVPIWR